MYHIVSSDVVSKDQVILLCTKALRYYDERLVDHGERVAYIASEIYRELYTEEEMHFKELLILSVFHDVGAFKTEEIDRMAEFECQNVLAHSAYGSLFLKYFTPLGPYSEAILYHHLSCEKYKGWDFPYKNYANLIHLADRIDIAIGQEVTQENLLKALRHPYFDQDQVDGFERALRHTDLWDAIVHKSFRNRIFEAIGQLDITTQEAVDYLKMLVYSIDFKSKYTVEHSINTTSISTFFGQKLGLDVKETEKIYFGALVHDLGKIAIPESILEYPGSLTIEEMNVMKTHVRYTEEMIQDVFPEDIKKIAIRHHEKLDGSGYPYGLKGDELSMAERIVAVADIISALISKRSYKERFSKEKTLRILDTMVKDGLIDSSLVAIFHDSYEEVMALIQERNIPIQCLYHKLFEEYNQCMKNDLFQEDCWMKN